MASHLGKDSDIVHNKNFENGIVEIQDGEENKHNANEKESVKIFLIANNNSGGDEEMTMDNEESFVDSTLKAALVKKEKATKYHSTKHVSPTSNICERLFSRASIIMTPNRRSMDPDMLEMIIMLRFNKDLWDEETIQQCMVRLNRTTLTSTSPHTEVTPTPASIATTTSSGSKRTVERKFMMMKLTLVTIVAPIQMMINWFFALIVVDCRL